MNKLILSIMVASSLIQAKEEIKLNFAKSLERTQPTANTIASYNSVIANANKSVVYIATQKSVNDNIQINPFMNDPFFREFFRGYNNPALPQERVQNSLGSGVIISKDGYIITNNHVIDGAESVKVTLPDESKEYEAKVVGKDAKSDLAIIKIEVANCTPITFYNSDDAKIGDIVFALGNPFGVGQTVTQGIISATGRNSVGITEYENFIQTDASINPGNSGGALINSAGYLVGINSAILSKSGGNVGIGFAIPSNMVQTIAKQLINNGKFTRAYLGVGIANVTDEMSKFYDNNYGALITSVEEKTPAQKAGIQRGDLILAIDDQKVENAAGLKNIIGTYAPNTKVKIKFLRDKKIIEKSVLLGSQDANRQTTMDDLQYEGLHVSLVDGAARNQFGIGANIGGVIVSEVDPKSTAAKIGVNKGDVIIQIENSEIKNLEDFKTATAPEGKKRVYLYRRGAILAVVL